jgi:hypothetical protein
MLRFGVTSVACLALLASGLQLVTAGSAGAATSSTYSDPVWFPVRDTVQVGCIGNHSQSANNNDATAGGKCDRDHPRYFGMNIDAIPGKNAHPKIWAAGAGIVRVADKSPGVCGGTNHAGQTVEIDHGGGVVSVYEHLQSITVKVGQHVNPSTPIGTMGHSGLACTSSVNYLDFQIRNNGGGYLNADTTSIRTMFGCSGAARETWPAGLGLSYNPTTWVQVKYLNDIDTSGGSCYPTGAGNSPATPARPALRPGIASAALAWPAVTGANRYMVQTQIFRNGTGWEAPCSPYQTKGCTAGYTAVAGSATRTTITGLLPARQYRLRFSAHSSNGWSPASGWVYATTAPTFRKFRTTTSLVEIYWSMYPATKLTSGRTTGFQVAIAKVRHRKVGTWHYAKAGAAATNYTFTTRHGTRYALKVRPLVSGGSGAWMKVHAVTTP